MKRRGTADIPSDAVMTKKQKSFTNAAYSSVPAQGRIAHSVFQENIHYVNQYADVFPIFPQNGNILTLRRLIADQSEMLHAQLGLNCLQPFLGVFKCVLAVIDPFTGNTAFEFDMQLFRLFCDVYTR